MGAPSPLGVPEMHMSLSGAEGPATPSLPLPGPSPAEVLRRESVILLSFYSYDADAVREAAPSWPLATCQVPDKHRILTTTSEVGTSLTPFNTRKQRLPEVQACAQGLEG